jgi:hypothetical protein
VLLEGVLSWSYDTLGKLNFLNVEILIFWVYYLWIYTGTGRRYLSSNDLPQQ